MLYSLDRSIPIHLFSSYPRKSLRVLREQYSDCPVYQERTIPIKIVIHIAFLPSLSLSPLSYQWEEILSLISSPYLSVESCLELGIIGVMPPIQGDLVACSWWLNLLIIWWLDGERIWHNQLLAGDWRA